MEVLLVDDNDLVRGSIRRWVHAKTKLRVIAEAAGAREALELLRTLPPDVVITDVPMAGMKNGIELTREIKQLYPLIQVLGLTSAINGHHQSEAP